MSLAPPTQTGGRTWTESLAGAMTSNILSSMMTSTRILAGDALLPQRVNTGDAKKEYPLMGRGPAAACDALLTAAFFSGDRVTLTEKALVLAGLGDDDADNVEAAAPAPEAPALEAATKTCCCGCPVASAEEEAADALDPWDSKGGCTNRTGDSTGSYPPPSSAMPPSLGAPPPPERRAIALAALTAGLRRFIFSLACVWGGVPTVPVVSARQRQRATLQTRHGACSVCERRA